MKLRCLQDAVFYDFCEQTHKIEISKGAIFSCRWKPQKGKNQVKEREKICLKMKVKMWRLKWEKVKEKRKVKMRKKDF